MAQNDKNFCLTPYMRTCTSYDCGFWCTCVRSWYLEHFFFFHFFKILIFQVFQSSSINAKRKFWGVPHLLHMCVFFMFVPKFLIENFVILQTEACLDFWYIQGVIERNQSQKLGVSHWERGKYIKYWATKSKHYKREKPRVNILIPKSWYANS